MDPLGDGRHILIIDDEQHIPARWRKSWFRRRLNREAAAVVPMEMQIDHALLRIDRMSRRHWTDELNPLDRCCFRRAQIEGSAVDPLRRDVVDRRARSTKQIRREDKTKPPPNPRATP